MKEEDFIGGNGSKCREKENLYKMYVIIPVVNTQNEKPSCYNVMIKWIPTE
jgi:hypothetical protein